jgi:hypothetical protein
MQAFDIALYALAIIAVLILRAESHTATVAPTEPQPQPIEAPKPIEGMPAPAMAQTIAAPVVSLTIPTESSTATDYATLKTPELRKLCSAKHITWRNAKGKNAHLSKGEMIQALMA